MANLPSMPPEIKHEIITELDPLDVVSISETNKVMLRFVRGDKLWAKDVYCRILVSENAAAGQSGKRLTGVNRMSREIHLYRLIGIGWSNLLSWLDFDGRWVIPLTRGRGTKRHAPIQIL
jgi:hypothetical protein